MATNLANRSGNFKIACNGITWWYSQKYFVGVCGPLPKTLALFMTKMCDFPYPIYDLAKNLIPYLWPDS